MPATDPVVAPLRARVLELEQALADATAERDEWKANAKAAATNGRAGIRVAEAKWAETGALLNACKAQRDDLRAALERIASRQLDARTPGTTWAAAVLMRDVARAALAQEPP